MNGRQLRLLMIGLVAANGVIVGADRVRCEGAGPAAASTGTVLVGVEGEVEISRGSERIDGAVNVTLRAEDILRTSPSGRASVSLDDGSAVVLGRDTVISMLDLGAPRSDGSGQISLRLERGIARFLVATRDSGSLPPFTVLTPTAAAKVTGTDFVGVVDPDASRTDVLLDSGELIVFDGDQLPADGDREKLARAVVLRAQEMTRVTRGSAPTPPQRFDQTTFRQYLDGLEFVGLGSAESLTANDPLLTGAVVSEQERIALHPWANVPELGIEPPGRDASTLVGEPPVVLEELPGNVDLSY